MNPEISNVRKLISKTDGDIGKGWYFTVSYDMERKYGLGFMLQSCIYDSELFKKYNECRKACSLWVKENL